MSGGNLMGASLSVNSDLLLMLDSEMVNMAKQRRRSDEFGADPVENDGVYRNILSEKLGGIGNLLK
jgi:hypothetical protein